MYFIISACLIGDFHWVSSHDGVSCQVTSALILLLAGTTAVQNLTLTAILGEARQKTRVVAASIADPYVLLHLSDGTAALLKADLTDGK